MGIGETRVSYHADDLTDEAAALRWPDGTEDRSKMVMPGDNVEMMCEIWNPLAIEQGQRFNVREGECMLKQSKFTLVALLGSAGHY